MFLYGCLYMPLNRAYLNILTLFFYKCVWLKSQTNKYIKKYKINMKKNKINIK